MSHVFFVGSYTEGASGEVKGKGIYTCTLDPSTGRMNVETCLEGCKNPSYLALDEANRRLFAVQECGYDQGPAVHAFTIDERFALEPLNSQSVPGEAPCYLALNADKRFLTVANYGTGTVVLYPVAQDGTLGQVADEVVHTGRSVNPDRQEGPHPHATVFGPDPQTVYVPDLGTDEIRAYHLDSERAKLEPLSQLKMPAGAGPRHLVFHPEGSVAFVVNELDSSLSLLRREAQSLTLLNSVSTLPADFHGVSTCAAVRVHPSGNFVYASNRGDDSIAVFTYDKAEQRLIPFQLASTQGRMPRDFALAPGGDLAVVANQQTNNIASYWLNGETGKLEPTGHQLEVGTPVCIAMTERMNKSAASA